MSISIASPSMANPARAESTCEFCRIVQRPTVRAEYLACFLPSRNVIPMCGPCLAYVRAHPEDGPLEWVRSL